jgi:hypothetical protein
VCNWIILSLVSTQPSCDPMASSSILKHTFLLKAGSTMHVPTQAPHRHLHLQQRTVRQQSGLPAVLQKSKAEFRVTNNLSAEFEELRVGSTCSFATALKGSTRKRAVQRAARLLLLKTFVACYCAGVNELEHTSVRVEGSTVGGMLSGQMQACDPQKHEPCRRTDDVAQQTWHPIAGDPQKHPRKYPARTRTL